MTKIEQCKNEMIISASSIRCSVKINGITQSNEFNIYMDFLYEERGGVIAFMKRYNIHRLIVCKYGYIDIYTR